MATCGNGSSGAKVNTFLRNFRECWVPKAPVGIGEIEMGNRVLWVEGDGFLKGLHRNFSSTDLFLKDAEVVPQDGHVSFGGRFCKE